ncbi:MAG: MBL fold metallo-hydrolase [Paludibacteraceae bacterium]|nr:MBL fold metallo-hydrolase [Paludibacteraceae bacterium]MBN2787199.1 MBL fold metallo-hydrolase [Paludibacteraceae bacterium]
MKVSVLLDNRTKNETYSVEHGLSVYVEVNGKKCLLDLGLSDAFISNAKKIGVDIAEIDYVFLSHGHVDHVGGLPYFLQLNSKAQIIMHEKALSQKYFSKRKGFKDIGLKLDLNEHLHRFKLLTANTTIDENIRVITQIAHPYATPKANATLYKDAGNGLELDDFNHELIVCFGKEELIVSTGCAHNGLLNILHTVDKEINLPIKIVVGGFHLLDADETHQYESYEELEQIALQLKQKYATTTFYTGHCTGDVVVNQLKKIVTNQINQFYVGMDIPVN